MLNYDDLFDSALNMPKLPNVRTNRPSNFNGIRWHRFTRYELLVKRQRPLVGSTFSTFSPNFDLRVDARFLGEALNCLRAVPERDCDLDLGMWGVY